MRGSPLLRAVLTLVIMLTAAWPVWRVTHAKLPPTVAEPDAPASLPSDAKAQLTLDFLPAPPLEFDVKYLGRSIWRGGGRLTDSSPPLEIQFPPEGIDLQITAQWPAEMTNAAVRMRFTTPAGATIDRLAWTHGLAIDEVVTFQQR
jgi:hypothetical protein